MAVGSRSLRYYGAESFRRAFRRVLLWWFGISEWHLASADNKPYVKDIVAFLNGRHCRVACELGCGLGDIVSRLNAAEKYGFDSDPGVIRAAKILALFRRDSTSYQAYSAQADNLPSVAADAWILVNWLHEISPWDLRSIVRTLLSRVNDGGCLILDSVEAGASRYHHDPRELVSDLAYPVSRIGGAYPFGRSIYVIEKDTTGLL